MKYRLIAGTINDWPDDDEWRNFTLDASGRGVWNRDLGMGIAPSFTLDVRDLTRFSGETFDEVRLHHVLEHLPFTNGSSLAPGDLGGSHEALYEIERVLKRGGVLDIEVPLVSRIIDAYVAGDVDLPGLSQWLLGEQLPDHALFDCHRSVWTDERLRFALGNVGLDVPNDEEPSDGYAVRYRVVKP